MPPSPRRAVWMSAVAALAAAGAACDRRASPPASPPPAAVAAASPAAQPAPLCVVIVHGVGNQQAGYSLPLQEKLTAALGTTPLYREVLWSDLGSLLGRTGVPPEARRAEQEWQREIDEAARRLRAERVVQDPARLDAETRVARGYVGPVVRYEFLSATERGRIQQRLREALSWAGAHAERRVVVAHSLGSVIAFDVLHAWEGGSAPPPVALLLTLGSPLGRELFRGHRGRPTTRPQAAASWANVYSTADPIASGRGLAGRYTGVEDLAVATPRFPVTAHGAYWTHPRVTELLSARVR